VIRDLIFILSLYTSLILYSNFLKKYYYSPIFLRALALALFYGILNIFSTLILIQLYTSTDADPLFAIFLNGKYGIVIGLGLGIGIDLANKINFSSLIQKNF
jgi:hypothetical protein